MRIEPYFSLICVNLKVPPSAYLLAENFRGTPPSPAVAMLSRSGEDDPLRSFAHEIGAELAVFGDLALLEQAYRFAVAEPGAIGKTIAAVRLIERLSPQQSSGESAKQDLLIRLTTQIESATCEDVLALRNLVLSAYRKPASLWASLSQWVATSSFPPAQDNAFRSMIADTTGTDATQEWRAAVASGLTVAAADKSNSLARGLWRWIESTPEMIKALWPVIGKVAGMEERLVGSAPPRLQPKVAQPIVDFASKEPLYSLHAVLVSAFCNPVEAARLQLKVAPPATIDSIRLALRNASPREVVASATEIADPRLIVLAGEAVSTTPGLLVDFDLTTGFQPSELFAGVEAGDEASAFRFDKTLV
ncbi:MULTISPECIES: hypothetical protein [unclassified Bradyrhizobium]|uniref:hypothetical protein n=1 Tax=Bradyrhizobium sp. USDA 4541 TaxID=2817704 RepID=UPI0020A3F98A|nr:hypothetical protein [Bradyrhizobium sp. USDA 4541]MCP1854765.1 hypothetical protein [Bradyrhizobium sp. USDA 4541]